MARTMTVWVKWQIVPLYQRLSHVLNLGGLITVMVRLRFSATSWPLEPTARKNAKIYRGDVCPGDNRHGSFRHRKGALNPPLVAARKILNRRSEILRRTIGWLETSVLARRILDRRMIQRVHRNATSLPPTTLPFLVRKQNFRHFLCQLNVSYLRLTFAITRNMELWRKFLVLTSGSSWGCCSPCEAARTADKSLSIGPPSF